MAKKEEMKPELAPQAEEKQMSPAMEAKEEIKKEQIEKAKKYLEGVSMNVLEGQAKGLGKKMWYVKLVKEEMAKRAEKKK